MRLDGNLRRAVRAVNLLNLMVNGGVLSGAQRRKPHVIHAITTEAFIKAGLGQRMPTAPCGAKHLRFVSNAERQVLLWPVRAEGPFERCRECWVATGKKRPAKARTQRADTPASAASSGGMAR